MKSLVIGTAAVALCALAAPAFAQPFDTISAYGTLGAADSNVAGGNTQDVTGRLGARFGRYLGIEGELSGGIGNAPVNLGGSRVNLSTRDQYAAYAVGYAPVLPNADLFARIGYGASDIHVAQPQPGANFTTNQQSWNVGAGGQYFFNGKDGVRADYTRETFSNSDLDANVWSVAFVRKF